MQSLLTSKPAPTLKIDLDDVIDRIMKLQFNSSTNYFPLTEFEIEVLCAQTREIIAIQPMLLELKPPMNVLGDIHGQFHDLLKLMKMIGPPDKQNFLFLGDYVDRGKRSLESFCLLMAYKIRYPQNFFILRGNHECSEVNKIYGFFDQVKRKFNIKLWKTICNVFNYLPLAAVIGDRIFCIHGGLSPQIKHIRDINTFKRPIDPVRDSPITDMLWSDPSPVIKDWAENMERGISYYFGIDIIDKFLTKYDFDFICRSHQVVEEGYEFFNDRKLLTIFSAPNYCGEFQNLAAVLKVDKDMKCSLEQLDPNANFRLQKIRRTLTPIPPKKKGTILSAESTTESVKKQRISESLNKQNVSNMKQSKIIKAPELSQTSSGIKKNLGRRATNGKMVPVKEMNIQRQSSPQDSYEFL